MNKKQDKNKFDKAANRLREKIKKNLKEIIDSKIQFWELVKRRKLEADLYFS